MNSKIFKTLTGNYVLAEFSNDSQNISVIPLKYSRQDSNFKERVKLLENKLSF